MQTNSLQTSQAWTSPFTGSLQGLCFTALLCLLLLAGCTTAPVQTQVEAPPGWTQQQLALREVTDWQVSGKLGVRQDNRSDSAVINQWVQQDLRFDINLSSPVFGLGATSIQGTPDGIWFTRSGEQPLYSENPEGLIRQQVGWSLPIRHLLYWVKGIPAPGPFQDMLFDQNGNLYQLEQAGWNIIYENYHDTAPYALPRKIVLRRDKIRLTLIIHNWDLKNPL